MNPVGHDELAADLAAWQAPGGAARSTGWLARPAVLRRAARLLADDVPAGVDALLCYGPDALPLGTAVSLHTGLPLGYAAAGALRLGSLRPGDRVAVVAITAAEAATGAGWAASRHVEVLAALAVFGPSGAIGHLIDGDDRPPVVLPGPALDPAADPVGLDAAARALAESLGTRPALVVSWADGASQVLAHGVARELGTSRAVIDLDLGLLDLVPTPRVTGDALLVAPVFDGSVAAHVPAVQALLHAHGLELAAVAALTATSPALLSVPLTALAA